MRKKHWISILLVVLFLAGLSLLLYPSVSDYWNSLHQSRAVASYVEEIAQMDDGWKEETIREAREFNEKMKDRVNSYALPDELRLRYDSILNIKGTGVMGYVDIPAISVTLPIYHGTSASVLQIAVGHLEWTYLPVGGEGTHSVVSGHRGLPSAKLFTDLDKLVVGDLFMLQILNETLTYEIDQILTVEPEDATALKAQPGKDLCTLVTCTPYGVNTHRLLVRGHRVENVEAARLVRVVSEAMQIEPMIVAPVVAIPLLMLLLVVYLIDDGLRQRRRRKQAQTRALIEKNL